MHKYHVSGFFRYPGGKAKLAEKITRPLKNLLRKYKEYREPFFGGGSIGLTLLKDPFLADRPERFWINDQDKGVYALWHSVIHQPDELKQRIQDFQPSVAYFDEFKTELLTHEQTGFDKVDIGFKKLALHQISYSGLGTKSGGPLGGRLQKSDYKIDCRWSPHYICKEIDKSHRLLKHLQSKCTNGDFNDLIEDDENPAVIYLDPPYYDKGSDLYQHSFNEHDHERLAKALQRTSHQWLLSYDDHPTIRKLYDWADISEISVNYSITSVIDKDTGKRASTKKPELLIARRDREI